MVDWNHPPSALFAEVGNGVQTGRSPRFICLVKKPVDVPSIFQFSVLPGGPIVGVVISFLP